MVGTQRECIAYLEEIRWHGVPKCPYCGSQKSSAIEEGLRHHCNSCYTSYSVTVDTLFHQTHIELNKWFQAIQLFVHSSQTIRVRQLAREINVTKNTASSMIKRMRDAMTEEDGMRLLLAISARQQTED